MNWAIEFICNHIRAIEVVVACIIAVSFIFWFIEELRNAPTVKDDPICPKDKVEK